MTQGSADPGERDRLVIEHVGLVKAMARRMAHRLPSQVDVQDLIGVGVIGLFEAADRYRPAAGVPFDAFARRRLQGAMLDALRQLDWAPRSARKLRRHLDATIATLRHALGREPREQEIANAMGLSADDYARALDSVRSLELGSMRQLDAPAEDGAPAIEVRVDPDEGPDAILQRSELRQHLAAALLELPERERHVLALYYDEELTMAETGAVIGVSESRVSQLRSLALARLRSSMRARLENREGR